MGKLIGFNVEVVSDGYIVRENRLADQDPDSAPMSLYDEQRMKETKVASGKAELTSTITAMLNEIEDKSDGATT